LLCTSCWPWTVIFHPLPPAFEITGMHHHAPPCPGGLEFFIRKVKVGSRGGACRGRTPSFKVPFLFLPPLVYTFSLLWPSVHSWPSCRIYWLVELPVRTYINTNMEYFYRWGIECIWLYSVFICFAELLSEVKKIAYFFYLFLVLGLGSRALQMLGKHSITELHPSPYFCMSYFYLWHICFNVKGIDSLSSSFSRYTLDKSGLFWFLFFPM
jgi:hypothetical protein